MDLKYTQQMQELIQKQLNDSRNELIRDLKDAEIPDQYHIILTVIMRKFMQW